MSPAAETCHKHVWRDLADASEPPEPVAPLIGRWPGVRLMQIGGRYACCRCQVQIVIEAASGGRAWVRWHSGQALA